MNFKGRRTPGCQFDYMEAYSELKDNYAALKAERDRYRKALEHYAELGGKVARAALKGEGP